jgi:hypothetical protein
VLSSNDVWVVGDFFDGTIRPFSMHWDGLGWTVVDVPVPNDFGDASLYAVDASDPGNIWAGGGFEVTGPDGYFGTHVYALRWNGSDWDLMDAPIGDGGSGDRILGIEALASDDVWFVGEAPPLAVTPQPSLAMHWDGNDFEIVPTPPVNTYNGTFGRGNSLIAVSALATDDIWAVGAAGDGDPIRTDSQILHWDGSNWVHVPGPVVGVWHSLESVVAIAPDDVWAGGESFDGVDYHGLALHWDGSSWTEVPTPGGLYGLVASASDDVYGCGNGILHWNGTDWSVIESFSEVYGPSVSAIDAAPASSCEIWAGGRQLDDTDSLFTLVVRSNSTEASWTNYGSGWPGTGGIPSLTADADPVLSTSIKVSVGNSRAATTPALVFVGFAPANLPAWDGTLLVTPSIVFSLVVPGSGIDLPYDVPSDSNLAGLSLFVQVLEVDPGASRGVSFTEGLELVHGSR